MSNKSVSNQSTKQQCEAILKSGQRCKAWAVRGGKLCALHDPRLQKKISEGRKRGGRMPRAKVLAKELKEIKTFEDLLAFLNKLIQDTYLGRITAKQSQAITTALSGIRATILDMMDTGGGESLPKKLYDFNPAVYEAIKKGERPQQLPPPQGIEEARVTEEKVIDVEAEEIEEVVDVEEEIKEEAPKEEQEEGQEAKEEKEEHSTVKFTDTEEFWDRLERKIPY